MLCPKVVESVNHAGMSTVHGDAWSAFLVPGGGYFSGNLSAV